MIEHQHAQQAEREVGHKIAIKLPRSNIKPSIGNRAARTHPTFFVRLLPDDVRLFGGIQMKLVSSDPESGTVDLEFEESNDGSTHYFGVDDVRLMGGRILAGTAAEIVCHDITEFGQAILLVAARKNIKVRSKERIGV